MEIEDYIKKLGDSAASIQTKDALIKIRDYINELKAETELKLETGDVLKRGDCFYCKNDPREYIFVRALEEQIVIKYFGINKKWWHYKIESTRSVNIMFKEKCYYLKEEKC